MIPSEELFDQIKRTTAPDKNRILKTRALALHVATFIDDRVAARKLVRDLNMAYLHLQFATLSEHANVKLKCREQCLEAATHLCAAARIDDDGQKEKEEASHTPDQRTDESAATRANSRENRASAAE